MTENPPDDSAVPVHIQKLLSDQQEANQKLVLAMLHAQALRDEAESAIHVAQEAGRKAESAEKVAQALAEDFHKRELNLLEAAEFREQLLAIVGHDLRNPLQAIAGSAHLLTAHGALSKADAQLVERVRNSAQRMARLISQLLDLTRARLGGGIALDLQPTDLREVGRQVIDELEVGSGAKVHLDLQGELTGTWDADRLAQVLSNIVGNAIDHAAPGTCVLLTATESASDVFIAITNQGKPIPPAVLPVLFQPFRSGRSLGYSKVGHLGLGLYISYQVVLAHGGALTGQSADGTTTFSIRLPRFPDAAQGGANLNLCPSQVTVPGRR